VTHPNSDRLRILFVTPYVPQPLRPRSWRFIQELEARGHDVTLAVASTGHDPLEPLDELRRGGIRVLHAPVTRSRRYLNYSMSLLLGEPLQHGHAWSPGLAHAIRKELESKRYDILHVEHLRAARYALAASDITSRQKTRRVWDAVDCISTLLVGMTEFAPTAFLRLAARLELPRTERDECRLMPRFDRILVASETDRQDLLALAQRSDTAQRIDDRARVIPNGVGLPSATRAAKPANRREPVVAFTGVMRYHANEAAAAWLIQEIMPRVWRQNPPVRLVLAGADPTKRLRRLIGPASDRIRLAGRVPSLSDCLEDAAVAVAPLRYGTGIQNKVLEAWAARTPVVADPRTASALAAVDGHDLLTATTADEFAETILRLLADPDLRERIGAAGHRRAVEEFRWERIVDRLEQSYRELLE